MPEWSTYSLIDFVPVTREVYLRLFERFNEAVWPTQFAALALGIVLLIRFWTGYRRYNRLLLAGAFVWVGWRFQIELYANLNWAAEYAGWAFVGQGLLLLISELTGVLEAKTDRWQDEIGRWIMAFSMFGFPVILVAFGHSWRGLQMFAEMPDPTAMVALGFVLTIDGRRWHLVVVPVLWSLFSGLTSLALGLSWGGVPIAVAALTVTVLVYAQFSGR